MSEPKFKEGERVKYRFPYTGVTKTLYGTVGFFHGDESRTYTVKRDESFLGRDFVYEHEMEKLDA